MPTIKGDLPLPLHIIATTCHVNFRLTSRSLSSALTTETKEQVERILGVEKKKPSDGRLDWLSQQLSELRQSSAVKQVAVGTACGWVSGLVCGKFGRTAATAVGGSVICLHLAQQYGYITINWKRVNGDMAKAKKELEKTARDDAPEFLRQLQTFVVENMLLASGFGGGLLLGLASS